MKRPVVDPAAVSVLANVARTVLLTLVVVNALRGEWGRAGVGLMGVGVLVIVLALLPPTEDRDDRPGGGSA